MAIFAFNRALNRGSIDGRAFGVEEENGEEVGREFGANTDCAFVSSLLEALNLKLNGVSDGDFVTAIALDPFIMTCGVDVGEFACFANGEHVLTKHRFNDASLPLVHFLDDDRIRRSLFMGREMSVRCVSRWHMGSITDLPAARPGNLVRF